MAKETFSFSKIDEKGFAPPEQNLKNVEIHGIDLNSEKAKYNSNINERKNQILEKIDDLQNKIRKHSLKEQMLDSIINRTYTELENLGEREFTKRGQKQAVLIKQLEALAIIQDTIMKFEDMIYKYQKMLVDIEQAVLSNAIRIKGMEKEEVKADENVQEVMLQLQAILSESSQSPAKDLLKTIEEELKEEGY